MIRRRRPGRDRGSVTAELAVGLPALMVLLFAALGAVGAVTTKGRCVDAAREGALAASRDEPAEPAAARVAPPGSEVAAYTDAGTVTVSVRAEIKFLGGHLPRITVAATAVAAREPQPIGAIP